MPDDLHLPIARHNPEDIDLGAIKADLEFLIGGLIRLLKGGPVLCPGVGYAGGQLHDGRVCPDRR